LICDAAGLRSANKALEHVELEVGDFGRVLDVAREGDFVYFDPPYAPLSNTSYFTTYTKNGFDGAEQRRLAQAFVELDRRGCKVMLSNSSAPLIRELYEGFHIHEFTARRAINSKGDKRGPIAELLITNY
jgi:DNA adenine methylase